MNKEEYNILKKAVLIEQEGFDFYMLAAARTEDEETRAAFEKIAGEEQQHINWLKDLYNKMSGAEDTDLIFEQPPEKPGIFDWDKKNIFKGSLALSVFSIGVKMEKEAIDFYKKAARDSNSQEAIELYETLIEWERGHMEEFQKYYELLQEDWWNEQGFAPF